MQVWKKRQAILIGLNIRDRRKQLGLTQSNLAKALSLSIQSISLIERGKLKTSPEMLASLAEILHCELDDLLHSHDLEEDGLQELLDTAFRLRDEQEREAALEVLHNLYTEALAKNNSHFLAESAFSLCLLYNAEHKYTISTDWGQEALRYLNPNTELERILVLYTTLGHNFYMQGQMQDSFELLHKAEKMIDPNLTCSPQTGHLYYRMAIIKHALQNWDGCIWYGERALQSFELNNMVVHIGRTLMMLSTAYENQERLTIAYQYIERSIRLLSQTTDLPFVARGYHKLAELEFKLNQPDRARKHFLRSLKLKKQTKDFDSMPTTWRALAKVSLSEGNLEEAKRYLHLSLEQLNRLQSPVELAITWRHLGDLALQEGSEEAFLSWYKRAIDFFKQYDFSTELAEMAGELGEYYLSINNNRQAIHYLRLSNIHYKKLLKNSSK